MGVVMLATDRGSIYRVGVESFLLWRHGSEVRIAVYGTDDEYCSLATLDRKYFKTEEERNEILDAAVIVLAEEIAKGLAAPTVCHPIINVREWLKPEELNPPEIPDGPKFPRIFANGRIRVEILGPVGLFEATVDGQKAGAFWDLNSVLKASDWCEVTCDVKD
jgi:hypothetical protein